MGLLQRLLDAIGFAKPQCKVLCVGLDNSGKSTVIGILLRLYDLVDGKVLIDDVEVKDWNLTLLRDQIGLVQQVRPPVP